MRLVLINPANVRSAVCPEILREAALPVLDWFNVGMSEDTNARNAAAPDPPDGPASTVWIDCEAKALKVRVPDAVMGEPVMVNNPVLSDKATLVTVPAPTGELQVPSPHKYVEEEGLPVADIEATVTDPAEGAPDKSESA